MDRDHQETVTGALDSDADRLDVARALYTAFNEAGIEGIQAHWHSDIEWHDPPSLPGGGIRKGRAEASNYLREWVAWSDDLQLEVDELILAGDEVLAVIRARGRGILTGRPLPDDPVCQLHLIRDGKVARTRVFLNREDANRAAGLGS